MMGKVVADTVGYLLNQTVVMELEVFNCSILFPFFEGIFVGWGY